MTHTTVVARRTRVGGRIETEGSVLVEGRAEGAVRAGEKVTVAHPGLVIAEIEAAEVEIRGIVIGNVSATRSIEVAAGARVVGDLRAPEVAVAADATVEGRVERTARREAHGGRATVPPPPRRADERPTMRLRGPVPRPAVPPRAPPDAVTMPGIETPLVRSPPPLPRLAPRVRLVPRPSRTPAKGSR